jgi:hypothetical protein
LGVEAIAAEVCFCPSDKEGRCLVDFVGTGKIQIAAIHDIDSFQLDNQLVEDIDIVDFARSNDDYGGNVAMQIQKGMEFYRTLAFPKFGPGEKSQTEVDGGRVQGIDGLIQFDAEGISGIKFSGFCDEDLREIGVNQPIPVLIGVGKGIAGNLPPDAQVIKSELDCPQTYLDVPQAFPVGALSEGHAEVLVPAREADHLVIAVVPIHAFAELVSGNKVHQLGKDRFSGIHAKSPFSLMQETCTSE